MFDECKNCKHLTDYYYNYCRICKDGSCYETYESPIHICDDKSKLTEQQMNLLALIAMSSEEEIEAFLEITKENNKRCGNCKHDGESGDISGSTCYLCKRNPEDHRIDWWEKKGE